MSIVRNIFRPPATSYDIGPTMPVKCVYDAFPIFSTPPLGGAVYLYFHGNSTHLGELVDVLPVMASLLNGEVYAVEYPGYGPLRHQEPSESGLYKAADALWRYVVTQKGVMEERIVVWGFSLGSLCASHLAAKHPHIRGLVLESAFSSGMTLVSKYLGPVSRLLHATTARIPYSNVSLLAGARRPEWTFCMFHGGLDDMITEQHRQELERTVPPVNFSCGIVYPTSGHAFTNEDFMDMVRRVRQTMGAYNQ